MNKKTWIILIVVIVAVGIFLKVGKHKEITPMENMQNVAGQSESQTQNTPTEVEKSTATTTETATSNPTATKEVSTVKEFTVSNKGFLFDPKVIKVKKGDTVKITYKNGGVFHDFKIDEFNVATKRLSSGAQETVTFVADKVGTFEFYCSVGEHRAMGMFGSFIVE